MFERSRPLPTSAAEEDKTRVSCLRLAIFRVLVDCRVVGNTENPLGSWEGLG